MAPDNGKEPFFFLLDKLQHVFAILDHKDHIFPLQVYHIVCLLEVEAKFYHQPNIRYIEYR